MAHTRAGIVRNIGEGARNALREEEERVVVAGGRWCLWSGS